MLSAGDTMSQASPVLARSNGHLNLTLLNLTLPFLVFIFFNEAERMRSCHKLCVVYRAPGGFDVLLTERPWPGWILVH